MSPRSQRPSYSKTKELSRRRASSSPIERNVSSHHSSSSGDRVFKVDSVSTDDSFPWSRHTSSSGKTYYYNCKTEKSQWEKPKEWLEREYQLEQEKKKREAKERNDRDNSHPNQSASSKEKSMRDSIRELSNKRDSQGHAVIGNKYDREKTSYPRDENKRLPQQYENKRLPQQHENKRLLPQENKRLPQQYGPDSKRLPQQHTPDGKRSQTHHNQANNQANSHIVKTTSANTTAVSTTIHRPDQVFAKAETKVSPSGSLQDISPPVTPVIAVCQSRSPAVAVSPVITTRSPIMLTHRSPATMHNQSPVQPNAQRLLPMPHRTSTSTPPPPPPPIFPQVSPVQTAAQVRHTEASPKNSVRASMESSSKQQESATFNGLHGFSQSQLHPLQQATLLQQAQFQGNTVIRPATSTQVSTRSAGPSHFQPIKQSNSNPSSPQPFHPRSYQSMAPAVQRTTVASIKQPILHPPPQSVNLQEFVNQCSRELITHTLGWPADSMEKQALRSTDDTNNLCLVNSRLKADLIPLNFHHNLTRMRMGVGTKRIEFLREQTRKLESSDAVS
ncbi:WW domain-containing adapter with coiled-coil isoform X1 [Paramuricea clavata]|nr:WW domain-containing adapter with coiled-coil isoform X1 [Paramuricea clavata]